MRAISLTLFALASAVLVTVSFSTNAILIAAIGGGVSFVATFFVLKRNAIALSLTLCAYVLLAFWYTLLHQRPIAMLFVVIAGLLGWDAALIEKDLSVFPKEERKRFTLRHLAFAIIIVTSSLGIALPARLFRLRLGFTGTLSIALAALLLLIGLLRTLHPSSKRQGRHRANT